jgi:hypothetical protein
MRWCELELCAAIPVGCISRVAMKTINPLVPHSWGEEGRELGDTPKPSAGMSPCTLCCHSRVGGNPET